MGLKNQYAELVHYSAIGSTGIITIDSQHNRNALSRQVVTELGAHLTAADEDSSIRVVLIRAEGKVFCSGADLSEAVAHGMQQGAQALVDLQRRILSLTKPVVTRVQGPARAGGLGIVAASDIAICSEDATFALTEVRLGLAPAAISLTVLPRLAPRGVAYHALTGEPFSGAEAAQVGLVTRAVPTSDLEAEVERVCTSLSFGSPQGLRETKALLTRELVADIDLRGAQLSELSARLFGSAAAKQAMTDFLTRSRSA